jgi:hypothetical protein
MNITAPINRLASAGLACWDLPLPLFCRIQFEKPLTSRHLSESEYAKGNNV